MNETNKVILRSQIKSDTSLILSVLSVILCKWIALIFFVLSYNCYEKADGLLVRQDICRFQQEIAEAERYMRIGIIVAIVCIVLEIIIVTGVILGLGMFLSL